MPHLRSPQTCGRPSQALTRFSSCEKGCSSPGITRSYLCPTTKEYRHPGPSPPYNPCSLNFDQRKGVLPNSLSIRTSLPSPQDSEVCKWGREEGLAAGRAQSVGSSRRTVRKRSPPSQSRLCTALHSASRGSRSCSCVVMSGRSSVIRT